MNIGILANDGSWYFRDLQRAATERGHVCTRLDFERLVASVGLPSSLVVTTRDTENGLPSPVLSTQYSVLSSDPLALSPQPSALNSRPGPRAQPSAVRPLTFDAILVRTMPPGSLEQVVFRMDLLGRLETAGAVVVNSPKSLECAVDKFLTTARLHAAGLPVPETIVCEHEDDALDVFQQLGGDVVVKPLFGAEGRGIVRVSDPDLAHRTFRTLMRLSAVLYLQRFVEHEGFDVRVLVLDGKVLGGMLRRSNGDFRTNVARDAIAEPHDVTPLERDFALRATAATGARIAGVDLLYDRLGSCYVIEVNAVPGWQAFRRVTGIDVAAKLIESFEGKPFV